MNGQFRLIDLIDDLCAGRDVFFRFVRVVKDVMSHDVKWLTLDNTLHGALQFMEENNVRHVPVMDDPTEEEEEPYFVGVVSQRDIFRQISPYLGKAGEQDDDGRALGMKLGEVVTRNPEFVSPEAPLRHAFEAMLNVRVDMLPVLVDKKLVGVITTGDVLKLFIRLDAMRQLGGRPRKRTRLVDLASGGPGETRALLSSVLQTVEDIMTEEPVCLGPEASLEEVIRVMQRGRFRHVPVVEQGGKLAGIISDRDILLHLHFTGRRSTSRDDGFRSYLFATDPKDPSLRQFLSEASRSDAAHVLPSCGVYDAARKLQEMGVSCLPVVDEKGNIQGIVTVTDLMRALLAAYKLADGVPDAATNRVSSR